MKLKKLLILPMLLVFAMPWFGIVVSASEDVETEPVKAVEYTVTVNYSDDSSTVKGISYEPYIDPATFTVGFKIVEDLSVGHVIYDDPATAYIDGIRVNGNTVNTLNIAVEQGATYDVIVRTVYEDNLLGDVAKIIDGTFDFKTLLENPIMLLMGTYYALSIASILIASVVALLSKNKKVKTADEIAAKVDESAQNAVEKIRTEVTDAVLAEATPILQNILDATHNIVTALTLSTSKSKEAPLAMLETLQKSAENSDAVAIVDAIRKTVSEGIKRDEDTRAANLETIREIAQTTNTADTNVTKSVF